MRISDWSSDVCSSDLPYLANQFDLSFEWYLGKRGLLAAAVFVKDVKNLVLTSYYDMPAVVTQSDGSTRPITLAVAQPMNRSEEHTSELQYLMRISYAVFCLKKTKTST